MVVGGVRFTIIGSKRIFVMRAFLLSLVSAVATFAVAEPIPLWEPGKMPGKATAEAERVLADSHISNVSVPTLEFLPAPNPQGRPLPTMLVAPGGGYTVLSYAKEGVEPARWLNQRGVNAAVLKYRVPGDRAAALADARQALALLRANAEAWHIDPTRIGMMGFSAGAHLTASVAAQPDHGLACVALVYPSYLSDDGVALKPEVAPATPTVPTFVTQCVDDRSYVLSSLAYAGHLLKANRPVDYHLYASGGHGFGFRLKSTHPAAQWMTQFEAWLRAVRVIAP